MESPAGGPMVVVSHPMDNFGQEQLIKGSEFTDDVKTSSNSNSVVSSSRSPLQKSRSGRGDPFTLDIPTDINCSSFYQTEERAKTKPVVSPIREDQTRVINDMEDVSAGTRDSREDGQRSKLDLEIEKLTSVSKGIDIHPPRSLKDTDCEDVIRNLSYVGSMQHARKTSSSFSDLGDYEEFTMTEVGSAGRNTPNSPFASIYHHSHRGKYTMEEENGRCSGGNALYYENKTVLAKEAPEFIATGIPAIAGERLRLVVESAAYIIFYKESPSVVDDDSEAIPFPSDSPQHYDDTGTEGRPNDILSSRSFSSLGAAGHKLQTTNCFTQDYSHPTRSLGRGLIRASTSVSNGFLKGAAGLVTQTYQGGASGGVFGFAKGLGMGMLGLGTHTVKGAFRGVGQVTNVVGEMVLGSAQHFSIDGMLLLTNFRLIWTSQIANDTIEIPVASILSLENLATAPHVFNIECKTLFRANFAFRDERTCHDMLASFIALFASVPKYVFASVHHRALREEHDVEGDSLSSTFAFKPEDEYVRLGLLGHEESIMRLYDNSSFESFPTYPDAFVIPKSLLDEDLKQLRAYRSAGRIPATVWRHPHTKALLARCAQPCAGLSGFVAEADVKIVRAIQAASTLNSVSKVHFFDARSQMAATANAAQGKGTEDPRNYLNAELHFCDIANIHAVRSSFRSLSDVCQPGQDRENDEWNIQLQSTFWLMHLASILKATQDICACLCRGESVIVHCSDGWDRTAQMSALIELLLDPYYRTIQGFLMLIEKEWISFGHRFQWRYAQGECPGQQEVEEQSPVFVQWLDAVWQIWRQQSWAFEFDQRLLCAIYVHVYSGLFGNFLYNSQKEQREMERERPTRSLWPYLLARADEYKNAEYDGIKSVDSGGVMLSFCGDEDDLILWPHHLAFADPVCSKYV
uniref:Myotubularinlike protein putative n=1 Tax=Albugo laibachii Nc14 TaxID=890382 RepID=F0W9Z3_9STRA|nr:myotubularinlike protein putative [Albugo laibachii Nc14]|eukprot:CCA17961.1 myotubularinlike protein putative [Albugo laibachii Nc14]